MGHFLAKANPEASSARSVTSTIISAVIFFIPFSLTLWFRNVDLTFPEHLKCLLSRFDFDLHTTSHIHVVILILSEDSRLRWSTLREKKGSLTADVEQMSIKHLEEGRGVLDSSHGK